MKEKQVLKDCVDGKISKQEAQKILGISPATFYRWLQKYDLKLNGKKGRPKFGVFITINCDYCGTEIIKSIKSEKKFCKRQCYMDYKNANPEEYTFTEEQKKNLSERLTGVPRPRDPNPETPAKKVFDGKVRRLSEKVYEKHKQEINPNDYPRGLNGVKGAWQLDHIIPISKGYEMGMTVEELASKDNLQMLSWERNIKKGNK